MEMRIRSPTKILQCPYAFLISQFISWNFSNWTNLVLSRFVWTKDVIIKYLSGPYLGLQIHGCHCIRCKILWVPIVPSYMKSQNFAGASIYIYKFCGCLAPMAPVLNRPLHLERNHLDNTLVVQAWKQNSTVFVRLLGILKFVDRYISKKIHL